MEKLTFPISAELLRILSWARDESQRGRPARFEEVLSRLLNTEDVRVPIKYHSWKLDRLSEALEKGRTSKDANAPDIWSAVLLAIDIAAERNSAEVEPSHLLIAMLEKIRGEPTLRRFANAAGIQQLGSGKEILIFAGACTDASNSTHFAGAKRKSS